MGRTTSFFPLLFSIWVSTLGPTWTLPYTLACTAKSPLTPRAYIVVVVAIAPHLAPPLHYAVKNPPNDFKLVTAAVNLSSSSGVEDATLGRHATPEGDVISISHRSDLG